MCSGARVVVCFRLNACNYVSTVWRVRFGVWVWVWGGGLKEGGGTNAHCRILIYPRAPHCSNTQMQSQPKPQVTTPRPLNPIRAHSAYCIHVHSLSPVRGRRACTYTCPRITP